METTESYTRIRTWQAIIYIYSPRVNLFRQAVYGLSLLYTWMHTGYYIIANEGSIELSPPGPLSIVYQLCLG